MRAASVSDYRELARRRLPKIFFEYIDGGSYAEVTLKRNVADLEAIALRQRVMRDMSALDMSVTTLGQTLAMPVALAYTFTNPYRDTALDAEVIIHETNLGVHTPLQNLLQLPESIKTRMRLIHYPDFLDTASCPIACLREGESIDIG